MTKLIYIEGPDGAGKTTLINELKKPEDMFYHNGVYNSTADAFDTYHEQINCYEQQKVTTFTNFNCYLDRGPIAEVNYGLVMRGTIVPHGMYSNLLDRMKSMPDLEFILCLPPYEDAHANWARNIKNEYIKRDKQYRQVYKMYADLLELSFFGIKINHYDYTKGEFYVNSD